MSEPVCYRAIVTGFIDGELHCRTDKGEHLIIELGPAQAIQAKQALDAYVAKHDAKERQFK